MSFAFARRESIREKLRLLYGDRADETCARLERLGGGLPRKRRPKALWTQRDAVLITYADIVRGEAASPLEQLRQFLVAEQLEQVLTTVHLLPFSPSTSDDGFSVVDYRAVDPKIGTWDDVERLGESFGLMFDLVLNHCSASSEWFRGYLRGEEPYRRYFIEADPNEPALAQVTRPRSLPLLTEFETNRGPRHVWTTFSADQVDLNFAEPDVLVEMCDVLLDYVRKGARIIRLDAIAYLWKRIGTSCIHLPETHAVVKIMRMLLDEFAPGTLLLTETNVPHRENVGYFGDGDEAHLVYQFSLAPLLLDAFLTRDPTPLNRWLRDLESPRAGTTYFNFTASHDGIGVRPLEGLVDASRRDRLVAEIVRRGGRVSMKRNPDGSDSPYELNTTLFTALGNPDASGEEAPRVAVRRMIAFHAVMLGLQGVPGLYYHSLFGVPDWQEGVEHAGRARTINRRKFDAGELVSLAADESTHHAKIFAGLTRLLAIRAATSAFHPDANQSVPLHSTPGLIAYLRTSLDGDCRVLVLCNVSDRPITLQLSAIADSVGGTDLITGQPQGHDLTIPQESTLWLELT
ncbi:MAG: alpha-amylase family glycosyl hydrolase [Planctomycetaceae bacterium]